MKIISDTASLFSSKTGTVANITIVPACVIDGARVYRDYEDISVEEFLQMIAAGAAPTSSQPAIGDLIDVFEESEEEILALFIGDGLSGGYQNAVGAKNSIDDNAHIRIIDTKTLAGAEHYLVQKAVYLREQGLCIDEIERELLKSVETSAFLTMLYVPTVLQLFKSAFAGIDVIPSVNTTSPPTIESRMLCTSSPVCVSVAPSPVTLSAESRMSCTSAPVCVS